MKFRIFLFIIILIQSFYPVFRNEIYGFTSSQLQRHKDMLEGKSVFHNPWQYRIFSNLFVQGFHDIFSGLYSPAREETQYKITFRIIRVLQHIAIFYLLFYFLNAIGIDRYLSTGGLAIACWSMGNATCASDYSFNTYFDVIFYLLAALIVLRNYNILWFLPLAFFAAANRESAMLLPLMAIPSFFVLKEKRIVFVNRKNALVTAFSLLIFLVVFIGLRVYYGYESPGVLEIPPGLPALIFNVSELRTWIEVFSVVGILPLLVIPFLKELPGIMRFWFWLIVPIWFAVHFYMAAAREARLFLVPMILILIPSFLFIIQKWLKNQATS